MIESKDEIKINDLKWNVKLARDKRKDGGRLSDNTDANDFIKQLTQKESKLKRKDTNEKDKKLNELKSSFMQKENNSVSIE